MKEARKEYKFHTIEKAPVGVIGLAISVLLGMLVSPFIQGCVSLYLFRTAVIAVLFILFYLKHFIQLQPMYSRLVLYSYWVILGIVAQSRCFAIFT